MKHIIITGIILLSLFSFSFAQVGTMQDDTIVNYIDINKKKQGKWIKYYDNGSIRYKGFFINDIPTGTFMYYYSNGNIKSVMNYDDDGYSTTEMYWKNKNKAAKGYYNPERQRIKTWHIYYEDGSLASVINYDMQGAADGEVKMYYPGTNQLVLHCFYENGKKHGHYIKYFDSGLVHEEGDYKNGLKVGIWKLYSPEGDLEEEGPFVDGIRNGDWIVYMDDPKGDTVNYTHGRPDNYDEQMELWRKKEEWAREHQDQFRQPEDYLDNPIEFFKPSNVNNPYGNW